MDTKTKVLLVLGSVALLSIIGVVIYVATEPPPPPPPAVAVTTTSTSSGTTTQGGILTALAGIAGGAIGKFI